MFFYQYDETWNQSFFNQFTRLKQVSLVKAYTNEFRSLQNRDSQSLDKQTWIDTYVASLKEHIQICLRTMEISSLKDVIRMAKVVEAEFAIERTSFLRRYTTWHQRSHQAEFPHQRPQANNSHGPIVVLEY